MERMSLTVWSLFVCAVFSLAACSDGGTVICDPGVVQKCPCANDLQGVQSCAADGKSWGSCDGCVAPDGDVDDSSDGDSQSDGDWTDGDDTIDCVVHEDCPAYFSCIIDHGTCGHDAYAYECMTDAECVSGYSCYIPTGSPDGSGKCVPNEEPDGDAVDGDVTDGDTIDGDVIDGDTVDGDAIESDTIDGDVVEGDTGEQEEEEESGPRGTCSATGVPCDEQVPCASATAEIQGFCSASSAGGNYTCLYQTRLDRPTTYTCGDTTLNHCDSNFDCPTNIGCGGLGSSWCAPGSEEISKVCLSNATLNFGSTACTNDSQCTQTLPNVCLICGNGILDTNQEECDDNDADDGDGCSSICRFEGTCYYQDSPQFQKCAKDEDCDEGTDCMDYGCTCVY
jgi:cysteine-rich repeat protein